MLNKGEMIGHVGVSPKTVCGLKDLKKYADFRRNSSAKLHLFIYFYTPRVKMCKTYKFYGKVKPPGVPAIKIGRGAFIVP